MIVVLFVLYQEVAVYCVSGMIYQLAAASKMVVRFLSIVVGRIVVAKAILPVFLPTTTLIHQYLSIGATNVRFDHLFIEFRCRGVPRRLLVREPIGHFIVVEPLRRSCNRELGILAYLRGSPLLQHRRHGCSLIPRAICGLPIASSSCQLPDSILQV